MKKIFIFLGIFCVVIVALWVAARITGALEYYVVSTPANEPTLKKRQAIFTSNLKKPAPYKFITFVSKYEDSVLAQDLPDFKAGSHYIYRVCGVGGNSLQMKDGVLFVDEKNFDEQLSLKNQYEISGKDFNTIIEDEDKPDDGSYRPVANTQDSMIVTFDEVQVKKYQSKLKLFPFILNDTANGPFKWFDKKTIWTTDNFGPLIIPAGYYFGLGDNRHNALDSRYTGFIKADDIKGVVVNK